jgi:hypothetical protein
MENNIPHPRYSFAFKYNMRIHIAPHLLSEVAVACFKFGQLSQQMLALFKKCEIKDGEKMKDEEVVKE